MLSCDDPPHGPIYSAFLAAGLGRESPNRETTTDILVERFPGFCMASVLSPFLPPPPVDSCGSRPRGRRLSAYRSHGGTTSASKPPPNRDRPTMSRVHGEHGHIEGLALPNVASEDSRQVHMCISRIVAVTLIYPYIRRVDSVCPPRTVSVRR